MVVPPEFNLTIGQNVTGIVGLFQGVNNNLMYDMLGVMILISISVILFVSFFAATNHFGKSISATLYIAFFLAILLRLMGILTDLVMFSVLILLALSVALLKGRDY